MEATIAAQADTGRYNPLVGGVQIQSSAKPASVGTLGTVFYDTKNRRVLGLSNWHVLYPWPPPGGAGHLVSQPYTKIWPSPSNRIGTTILGKADGYVDAAIFAVGGRGYTFQIKDIGSWSGKLSKVALGTAVMKRGRTTGLTQGTVQYINATIVVDYSGAATPDCNLGYCITYKGLIGVKPTPPSAKFSDRGDSGSVVLDTAGKRLVSLNFAGNSTDGWGCPIDAVEAALDIAMTPDSTDTGVFNTMDVRPWYLPQLENSKSVVFAPPYQAAPDIAMGLTALDVDRRANLRIAALASGVSSTDFTASLNAWADTVLYSAGCTWLNELDVANKRNARVRAYVADVDTKGFTVHIDTWADTTLYSAGVTWIAYPAGKAGIVSGTFGTGDVRPWYQPRANTSATIAFPSGGFTAPPRVLVALTALDVDRRANLRIVSSANNITTSGMTWHLDSWADTILYSAGAAYIAIG